MVFYLPSCGCSTVAVHQLPKLSMRVRFPSPAPFILNSLSTTYNALKSIQKTRYQSVKFRFISTHGTLNQCFKCPISYHSQAEKSRGCCTATVLHPHDRTAISERLDEPVSRNPRLTALRAADRLLLVSVWAVGRGSRCLRAGTTSDRKVTNKSGAFR